MDCVPKVNSNSARVLVACEESQVVTIEMRKLGIAAYSCDTQPCSGGHPEWHLQQDVVPLLQQDWDMLLAFPPCTHLSCAGAAYFATKRADGRQQQGIDFFMKFVNAPSKRKAIENPVGIMSTAYRKPDQIIQPFWFGDSVAKSTCLWLTGLPHLDETEVVAVPPGIMFPSGKAMSKWFVETSSLPLSIRGKVRSKTFHGIAKAMATQWGKLLT